MQAITMNDHGFDAYRKRSDWIQRRIFPGAQLASIREILNSLVRSTRLSLFNVEDIGLHYAYTLAEWRRRFHEAIDEVRALGFDQAFCRMWYYYLAYCESAFRERHISDVQLMLTKNANPAILHGEPWKHNRENAVLPTIELTLGLAEAGLSETSERTNVAV
jgi:cyclopropane-fatty-acyl-phospholipid synthase